MLGWLESHTFVTIHATVRAYSFAQHLIIDRWRTCYQTIFYSIPIEALSLSFDTVNLIDSSISDYRFTVADNEDESERILWLQLFFLGAVIIVIVIAVAIAVITGFFGPGEGGL